MSVASSVATVRDRRFDVGPHVALRRGPIRRATPTTPHLTHLDRGSTGPLVFEPAICDTIRTEGLAADGQEVLPGRSSSEDILGGLTPARSHAPDRTYSYLHTQGVAQRPRD